ncbi:hypothetical protein vseg_006818 [Gypsophila vaccaria]
MRNNNNNNNNGAVRLKFGELLLSEEMVDDGSRYSNASEMSTTTTSSSVSPRMSSFCHYDNDFSNSTPPSNTASPRSSFYSKNHNNTLGSPYLKSPWIKLPSYPTLTNDNIYIARGKDSLIGSLFREEGHVYSLAAKDGMLFTGSESKNIRVWRDFNDAGGFKSGSGLVKAIVVSGESKVYTGHQDGKIRVWTTKGKRVGTLPKMGDYLRSAINPGSYVEVRRHHKVPRIRHFDAVSCMSMNEETGMLYSGSWDKTIKVWRVSDGKCMESIDEAHEDAINSVAVGYGGMLYSGSADGTVKVWRRELEGKRTRHVEVTKLLTQENAVTALGIAGEEAVYAGSSDGLVNFWEREEEELCYGGVLRGHKMAVLCLATAGRLVFTGSADNTICVWKRLEAGIHSCLSVLSAHTGPVKCLAIDRQAQDEDEDQDEDEERWVVYSGSLDKSVKIWRVSDHSY